VGAGCELVGVGGVQGDEGAGCVEGVRAGAELEEGAGEEEEPGQPFSRPGRDEFRPAITCRANSALVGGKGAWGSGEW